MGRNLNKKILVLIRHGHRGKKDGSNTDNGLSKVGIEQATALSKYFCSKYAKKSMIILSSPKRRCIETVEPLSKLNKAKIKIMDDLDEGGLLEEKISRFFQWWRGQPDELTVICSHGDWIPTAVQIWTGAHIALSKGGCIELSLNQDKMIIEHVLQNADLNALS